MLRSHMNAKEQLLLAQSGVASGAGHTGNRGTPREIFIRDFLASHLSEKVSIGTGEIIDSNSKPQQQRNQIDIVIYKREYPKLELSAGISAFLVESVVAIIEVKSNLTQIELENSCKAAKNVKNYKRHIITSMTTGYQPPSILSYVVAYDGPASMKTVYGWLPGIESSVGFKFPSLPLKGRHSVASPSIDGVFVLGKGFLAFDNSSVGFANDQIRAAQNLNWTFADTKDGTLLYLFLLLTNAMSGVSASWINTGPYLTNFSLPSIGYGP